MCLHDRYIDTSSVSLYLLFDIHCTRDAKLSPGGIPSSHIEHFAVGGCGGCGGVDGGGQARQKPDEETEKGGRKEGAFALAMAARARAHHGEFQNCVDS